MTIEGISRLEIDVARRRNYCLAITADARDRGKPSSWSAAIDNLACGAINETRRLIIISSGNTGLAERADYPAYNETASILRPCSSLERAYRRWLHRKGVRRPRQEARLGTPCGSRRFGARQHDIHDLAAITQDAVQARYRHGSRKHGAAPNAGAPDFPR